MLWAVQIPGGLRTVLVAMCVVVASAVLPVLPARAGALNVEERLLVLINKGRNEVGKRAQLMHAGLRAVARDHSAYQASGGRLNHDHMEERIGRAAPDPYEANGAPDDGFGTYCENVAYYRPPSNGSTDDQVAQYFYNRWYDSTPHRNCMFDTRGNSLNVAGVGIYLDGRGYWWATLESVRDASPPSTGTWRRYEQTSSAVVYSGSWSNGSSSAASGGTYRRSDSTGAFARFSFTGKGVRWIGIKAASGGYAELRLDGKVVATINQYARTSTFVRTLFERTGLSNKRHTFEVRVKGTRSSRSTGNRTWVDAFERLA